MLPQEKIQKQHQNIYNYYVYAISNIFGRIMGLFRQTAFNVASFLKGRELFVESVYYFKIFNNIKRQLNKCNYAEIFINAKFKDKHKYIQRVNSTFSVFTVFSTLAFLYSYLSAFSTDDPVAQIRYFWIGSICMQPLSILFQQIGVVESLVEFKEVMATSDTVCLFGASLSALFAYYINWEPIANIMSIFPRGPVMVAGACMMLHAVKLLLAHFYCTMNIANFRFTPRINFNEVVEDLINAVFRSPKGLINTAVTLMANDVHKALGVVDFIHLIDDFRTPAHTISNTVVGFTQRMFLHHKLIDGNGKNIQDGNKKSLLHRTFNFFLTESLPFLLFSATIGVLFSTPTLLMNEYYGIDIKKMVVPILIAAISNVMECIYIIPNVATDVLNSININKGVFPVRNLTESQNKVFIASIPTLLTAIPYLVIYSLYYFDIYTAGPITVILCKFVGAWSEFILQIVNLKRYIGIDQIIKNSQSIIGRYLYYCGSFIPRTAVIAGLFQILRVVVYNYFPDLSFVSEVVSPNIVMLVSFFLFVERSYEKLDKSNKSTLYMDPKQNEGLLTIIKNAVFYFSKKVFVGDNDLFDTKTHILDSVVFSEAPQWYELYEDK